MIVIGTTYYGFFLSFKQKSRIRRLKAFRQTIELLSGQIRYAYTSIPEAFLHIADKSGYSYIHDFYGYVGNMLMNKECVDFTDAWNQGIHKYVQDVFLTESDCEILKNVGTMPVYLDGDMQIKVLEETSRELEHLITEGESKLKEKCKIYQCTGFIAGIFIVLVLI